MNQSGLLQQGPCNYLEITITRENRTCATNVLNHGPNIIAKCTAGKSQCLFVYSLICVKYLTVVNNSILFHCCVFSRVIRHLWRNGAGSEVLGNVQRSLFQSLVFFKIIKILIPLLVSFFVS